MTGGKDILLALDLLAVPIVYGSYPKTPQFLVFLMHTNLSPLQPDVHLEGLPPRLCLLGRPHQARSTIHGQDRPTPAA
jgi:hypothetical protein